MTRKPLVSSLSMSFRRATMPETSEEAKLEHRENLRTLADKYMDDVKSGKAEGIRNARDLVEVMKMDLLLMGDVTDRTENVSNIDEVRMSKMSQYIDEEDPMVQDLMEQMMKGLNDANDDEDIGTGIAQQAIAQAELERFKRAEEEDKEVEEDSEDSNEGDGEDI